MLHFRNQLALWLQANRFTSPGLYLQNEDLEKKKKIKSSDLKKKIKASDLQPSAEDKKELEMSKKTGL